LALSNHRFQNIEVLPTTGIGTRQLHPATRRE
jgi:hypothetical protein